MPDMRNAMKKAGFKSHAGERKCTKCGRPFTPRDPKHKRCPDCARDGSQSSSFPPGYPDYFDSNGNLKCDYLTDLAKSIAERLGEAGLTTHQLRAFYGHAKRLHASLNAGRPFDEIYPQICKMKPFAEERCAKGRIPKYFADFICRNVDKAKDQKAFLAGFVEHFQSVVAYCAGTIKTR